MSQDNKGYWQRISKIYGSVMRNDDPIYRTVCEYISAELTREMNVLELACGTGQLSYPLSSKVRLWEATDFSENMIAEAKKKNHSTRLHFSVQDATDLPYAPGSFDAVVISNALHIMPEPGKALAEIHRVLKPGGTLYAPTIVWGECKKGNPFQLLLKLSGFKVYHSWDCAAFAAFVAEHHFAVTKKELFPDKRTPMCYLATRKEKEYDPNQGSD